MSSLYKVTMCTSFVSYYSNTLIGFNYDFKKCKTYLSVRSNGKDKAMIVYSTAAKQMYPQYLINSSGLFIALQNVNNCSMEYIKEKGDDSLEYGEFIEQVMFERSASKVSGLFKYKGLCFLNQFRVPMDSLQMMICDADENSYILNFDQNTSYITEMDGKCNVMTNFACCLGKPEEDGIFKEVYRYDIVSELLNEKKERITVEDCFSALDKVRNDLFSYTLLSAVYEMKEKSVYLCINREFDKVIKLNLVSGQIENEKGYLREFVLDITDQMLLLDTFNHRMEENEDCELFNGFALLG